MKTRLLFAVIFSAVMVLSGIQVYAQRGQKPQFDKIHQETMDKLGLSDEQKQKIKENREKNEAQNKEIWGKIKEKNEAARIELDKPQSDRAIIDNISKELKELEAQRIDQRVNQVLELKQILTPEQFKKMNEIREKKWEKGKMKMKGRGKDCPMPGRP